eukprot:symbB.v1.2.025278.t1/scaffold2445.1/size151041/6
MSTGNRSTWETPISRTLGKWCLFYQLKILHRACKEWEVRYLIRGKLAANWPGGTYDLLRWVLKKHRWLKVQSELKIAEDTIASTFAQSWLWRWESAWVRNLHETGAGVFQLPWPLSSIHSTVFGDSRKAIGCEGDSVDEQQDLNSLVGTEATFTSATSAAPALPRRSDFKVQGGFHSAT